MTTLKNIKQSALELKSIYALTLCAVLLALRVVLGFVSVGGDTYRITFSHLPVFICSYIFGPIPGAIVGGLGDIVTLIIKPTGPLNIGITLSEMLVGFISGLFLYRHKAHIVRTILSCITVAVICSLGITTVSILIMYNVSNPWIMFLGRVATNAVTVPVNIILLFASQQLIQRIRLPHLNIVK
ncbi:MAG: folate family ECF transporter S component [Acutalibacteraceae bacterium]